MSLSLQLDGGTMTTNPVVQVPARKDSPTTLSRVTYVVVIVFTIDSNVVNEFSKSTVI